MPLLRLVSCYGSLNLEALLPAVFLHFLALMICLLQSHVPEKIQGERRKDGHEGTSQQACKCSTVHTSPCQHTNLPDAPQITVPSGGSDLLGAPSLPLSLRPGTVQSFPLLQTASAEYTGPRCRNVSLPSSILFIKGKTPFSLDPIIQ